MGEFSNLSAEGAKLDVTAMTTLDQVQADAIGCHIITVTYDILKKLPLVGKDLGAYSLETGKMCRDDALKSGYTLQPEP